MLTRTWAVTLAAVGFDPYRGFYHQPSIRRPRSGAGHDGIVPAAGRGLTCVIQAINNGEVRPSDFIRAGGGVSSYGRGAKAVYRDVRAASLPRGDAPVFEYRVSYRRLFEIQARLLGRFLLGEISEYPNFTTRWGNGRAPLDRGLRHPQPQTVAEGFKIMKGFGEWLQLSVFQCRMGRMRHAALIASLDE